MSSRELRARRRRVVAGVIGGGGGAGGASGDPNGQIITGRTRPRLRFGAPGRAAVGRAQCVREDIPPSVEEFFARRNVCPSEPLPCARSYAINTFYLTYTL